MTATPAHNGVGGRRAGEVIARWSTPITPRRPLACSSCGERHQDAACPQCASPAGSTVGHMATLIEDGTGRPVIVVAQRRHGRWEPTRTLDATTDAIRALRRQHNTGGATSDGGLW